jgi:non-canonical purine NTP pyrophosphatase (RdgB/HAM1 family)
VKTITFLTSNTSKFEDVKRYFGELAPDINVVMNNVDIPEIQSLDLEKVAQEKAKAAWHLLQQPLLIDDGGIYLERFNKFPGAFSRYVAEGIGLDGIWLLAKDDPRASFVCYLVYVDGPNSIHLFKGVTQGKIVQPSGALKNPHFPYTEIFIPDGSDTLYAELRAQGKAGQFSHRKKAITELIKFLNN